MKITIDAKHLWLIVAVFFLLLAVGIYLFKSPPQIITTVESKPESPKAEISKAESPKKEQSKPEAPKTEVIAPQPKWEVVSEGQLDISKPWTRVGSYSGPIIINLSGTALLDPTRPEVSPDGVMDHPSPSFFTLQGAPIFCGLARLNGKIIPVGSNRSMTLETETEIYLGPNEDINGTDGPGFKDNRGFWTYKIYSKR